MTWECKVGGTVKTVQQLQGSSAAIIAATVAGTLSASSTAATFASMAGLDDAIDSSAIKMDTSGSSVQWPVSGSVLLTIKNRSNGQTVAAKSFAWSRSGSIVSFASPTAVDAWFSASGASATAHKIDYDFQNLSMPAQVGSNVVAVDIYDNGQPQATATATIAYDGYQPCTPTRTTGCDPW